MVQGFGNPTSPMCAYPNLEVFNSVGASFSDAVLLDFLRSRRGTGNTEGNESFVRLRKASIVVTLPRDGQKSESTRDHIKRLQAANPLMLLDLTFVAWADPKGFLAM